MAKRSLFAASPSIAALAAALPVTNGQPPLEFRLFPAGRFHAVDGRPSEPAAGWLMNAAVAARLIAAAQARQSDYVIDYEHQTLHAAKNGQPAPAAGWFHNLAWREGDGLYVVLPNWTAAAAAHVADRAYRYISPVFSWDKSTGAVLAIHHAALVNDPGLDGLTDFSALSAQIFATPFSDEDPMDKITELFVAAGLPAPADIAAATTALTALKAQADQAAALGTEVAALKAQTPDPAKFVPVGTMQQLQTQVAALSAQIVGGEVDGLVKTALADGKLLPVQESWARDLGQKDVAALKAYLVSAPANPALAGKTQTEGKSHEATPGQLSETERAVCKAQGISAEDFLKTRDAA